MSRSAQLLRAAQTATSAQTRAVQNRYASSPSNHHPSRSRRRTRQSSRQTRRSISPFACPGMSSRSSPSRRRTVELPADLIEDKEAKLAVNRAASGQRLWPLLAIGKANSKGRVSKITINGFGVKEDDVEGWQHVLAVMTNVTKRHEITARWHAFAREVGAPISTTPKREIDIARAVLVAADNCRTTRLSLGGLHPASA